MPGASVRGYSGRLARFCVGTKTREGIRKDTEESRDDFGRGAPGAMLLGRAWGLLSGGARGTVLRVLLREVLGDAGEGAAV